MATEKCNTTCGFTNTSQNMSFSREELMGAYGFKARKGLNVSKCDGKESNKAQEMT